MYYMSLYCAIATRYTSIHSLAFVSSSRRSQVPRTQWPELLLICPSGPSVLPRTPIHIPCDFDLSPPRPEFALKGVQQRHHGKCPVSSPLQSVLNGESISSELVHFDCVQTTGEAPGLPPSSQPARSLYLATPPHRTPCLPDPVWVAVLQGSPRRVYRASLCFYHPLPFSLLFSTPLPLLLFPSFVQIVEE
jgi:hypothetical protein